MSSSKNLIVEYMVQRIMTSVEQTVRGEISMLFAKTVYHQNKVVIYAEDGVTVQHVIEASDADRA